MDTDTYRGRSCEDAGEDWSDVPTNQGMARIARSHQKPGERQEAGSSPEPQREHGPADTVISDFWPPEL